MLVLIGAFVSVDRHKTAVLLITWATRAQTNWTASSA